MRIAVDATPVLGEPTGIGIFVRQHLERLGQISDLDVAGFGLSLRGMARLEAALPPGVDAKPLPYPAGVAREVWQWADWPRLKNYDVVHGTNYVVPPASGPSIVSVHDMTAWRYPELTTKDTSRYPALVTRAVARGAYVHTISDSVADELVDHYDLQRDRVRTVHLAVDPPLPGDAIRGKTLAGGDQYILAVGTVEPRKDYPTLVAALAELRDQHRDLRLVIAGGKGWGSEAFEEAVRAHRLEDRVVQLGYVSQQQKADLFTGSRCLAYPSVYEGFGIPPLEAMAAGIPVVASRIAAVEEVVGPAAQLVPPGESDELAAALHLVLTDDRVRTDLINAGHAKVQRYSWDATSAGLVEFYRSVA